MVLLLLWRLAVAAPDGGVEVSVYRSRAELPEAWRPLVAARFDFSREMLVTSATPGQPVELADGATLRQEQHAGALFYWPNPSPSPPLRERECPPCRGIQAPDDELLVERSAGPLKPPSLPLYRMKRRGGRVFEVREPARALAQPAHDCPPCTAQ